MRRSDPTKESGSKKIAGIRRRFDAGATPRRSDVEFLLDENERVTAALRLRYLRPGESLVTEHPTHEGGESEHLILGVRRDSRGVIEQDTRFYGIDLLRGDESNADLAERLGTAEREFFVVPLGGEPRSVFDA